MANGFGENAYGQNYSTGGGGGGGGGGGSGGGFFGGGSQITPGGGGGGGGGGRSGTAQSLRPVTIGQALSASQAHADAEWEIDGRPLNQLTFVGFIRSITNSATNVTYQVEDGSGIAEVRVWNDNQGDGSVKNEDITQWRYVRIIGTIKTFNDKRYIGNGTIRLITDPNEIFYHRLDAMRVHQLMLKGGSGGGSSRSAGADAYGRDNDGDDRMKLSTNRYEDVENPIQRKILQTMDALRDSSDEGGVAVTAISRRLTAVSEADIREHVETLVGEGFLFHTQDDEHVLNTSW